MKGYCYDKYTYEFLEEIELQIDPLETKLKKQNIYLIPANCVLFKPLEKKENEVNVLNNNEWEIKKDFRGYYYKEIDENKYFIKENVIEKIGIDIEDKITKDIPKDLLKPKWNETKNKWVEGESIEILKKLKIKKIKDKTRKIIQLRYPLYTQLNILNRIGEYKDDDKAHENFIKYIETIIEQGKQFQKDILNLKTIKDIKNYKIKFVGVEK